MSTRWRLISKTNSPLEFGKNPPRRTQDTQNLITKCSNLLYEMFKSWRKNIKKLKFRKYASDCFVEICLWTKEIPPRTQWASGISNGKSRKHANRCNKKSLRNLNKKIKHSATISHFCYVKGSFGSSTSSRPSRSWLSLSLWKSGSIRSGKVYSKKRISSVFSTRRHAHRTSTPHGTHSVRFVWGY